MKKIVLLGLLALIVVVFFQFDLEQYLTINANSPSRTIFFMQDFPL